VAARGDPHDEERAQRRALSWHFDEHGMLHVSGCLDAEEAAVLLAALDAIAGTLDAPPAARPAPSPEDPEAETSPRGRPAAAEPAEAPSRVDALTALARSFLNGDGDPRRDPDTQLVVTLDAQALERHARAGLAAYRAGGSLTGAQARRLASDTALLVILTDGPEVLDVGRSTPLNIGYVIKGAYPARLTRSAPPVAGLRCLAQFLGVYAYQDWNDDYPLCGAQSTTS